ncbi:MAG: hypothetical protein AAB706_00590 [Patescibacteria group bacterium]
MTIKMKDKSIFDTTDLEKEIKEFIKTKRGTPEFATNWTIQFNECKIAERQHLKFLVEKWLDEKIVEFRKNPSIASNMVLHLEELKKRLGIK